MAELAEIRTLKLNLLADVNQFGAGITQAEASVNGFGGTVNRISKLAAAAFAAVAASAGYMAIKLGRDAVNAAIEDEKSQVTLAKALQNTVKATDAQIAATEEYITKQQLLFGVSDTKLRPALGNLARATGDLRKTQDLTNLSLDIAAATGKDVESVSLALSKAYNGNLGALTRLGVPLDESIIKTKDFEAAQAELTKLFGGAAAANADTYAGKLAIVSEKTGELKESLGTLLLPEIGKLVDFANRTLLPSLQQVADGFAGKPTSTETGAYLLGESLGALTRAFGNLFGTLNGAEGTQAANSLKAISGAINALASALNALSSAIEPLVNLWNRIPDQLKNLLLSGSGIGLFLDRASQLPTSAAATGALTPPSPAQQAALNNSNVTINISGVVDGESARRSIEKVLQNSGSRTSPVKLARLPL